MQSLKKEKKKKKTTDKTKTLFMGKESSRAVFRGQLGLSHCHQWS